MLIFNSLDEAKKTLKEYISNNIPVIVQWTPHTILAYGYENGGDTILIYNPGDPETKLIPKTKWKETKQNISMWLQAPYLWQYRKFEMVVVKPKTKKVKVDGIANIEWKNISRYHLRHLIKRQRAFF